MSVKEKPKRKHGGGNPKGKGGRPKGAVNKVTRQLKEAILVAAEKVGFDEKGKDGLVGYLKRIALDEPVAFCGLLGKVLPLTLAGDPNNPVMIKEVGARDAIAERIASLAARSTTQENPRHLN